jgi:hypothetical protein
MLTLGHSQMPAGKVKTCKVTNQYFIHGQGKTIPTPLIYNTEKHTNTLNRENRIQSLLCSNDTDKLR